jgi:hypothetical protein
MSAAEQVMLAPSGKSNVPGVRQVRVSETSVAVPGAGPRSIVAGPVRVAAVVLPSCVSDGAPGRGRTPAARAAQGGAQAPVRIRPSVANGADRTRV